MHKTIWVWPWTVAGPLADATAARLKRLGVDRVTVVFPSDSPTISHDAPAAVEWGRRHDLAVEGLVHLFVNPVLVREQPDLASQISDGTPDAAHLCANHPDVGAHVEDLVRSVAAHPVAAVGVGMSRHADRSPSDSDPARRLLEGVCFCEHCRQRLSQKGINPGRLRSSIGRLTAAAPPAQAHRDRKGGLADLLLQFPPLYELLHWRMEVLAGLARRLRTIAAEAGKPLAAAVDPPLGPSGVAAGLAGHHYPSLCQICEPLYILTRGGPDEAAYTYAWARALCDSFAERLVPVLDLASDAGKPGADDLIACLADLGARRVAIRSDEWVGPGVSGP